MVIRGKNRIRKVMQKENLLDVLLYLFENYMDSESDLMEKPSELTAELLHAGYDGNDIKKALKWLDELQVALGDFNTSSITSISAVRIFSAAEQFKINDEARNYILYLEKLGFIDAKSRELIIDRAMSLDEHTINVQEIKWISLTVLLTQPERRDKLALLEALVLSDHGYVTH